MFAKIDLEKTKPKDINYPIYAKWTRGTRDNAEGIEVKFTGPKKCIITKVFPETDDEWQEGQIHTSMMPGPGWEHIPAPQPLKKFKIK